MENNVDNPQNIFKILIATDIHLGYLEKDAERGGDSFNTFEEILELAVAENVDFILLGGDLFHENKPSRNSILQCMELLKKYTFGNKQVHFDFLSDPSVNFPHLKSPTVNYFDPNLNISIPVFSIHGNHDDPSGLGQHSPLEILSITGLINYFGRVDNLNEINIFPLLMEKGQTKLALYGLSSVKDERLNRLYREDKVRMFRPSEDEESWFNILVLHQNHTKHSITNYIPEEILPTFLNLVIWGHEHECLIQPRKSSDDGFFVMQPGSSVATSLCAGEAVPKHIAVLEVDSNKKMRITPLPLQTVRPFVFEDLSLKDFDLPAATNKQNNPSEEAVEQHVKGMIEQAKQLISGHSRQPTKPLLRLRVEYSDESQMFNITRFGFKFTDSIANPDSIVLFRKFRKVADKIESGYGVDEEAMEAVFNADVSQTKVEDLVQQYFEELEGDMHKLQLLSERGLAHAVSQFVEKDYNEAISLIFENQVSKTATYLKNLKDLDIEEIEEAIESYYQKRQANKAKDKEETVTTLELNHDSWQVKQRANVEDLDSDLEIISDDNMKSHLVQGERGNKGARRCRGSKGTTRGTTSSRGNISTNKNQLENINTCNQSTARGSNRARRSCRARGTTVTASRTPSIFESFSRASTRIGTSQRNKRGATFDSDSDIE